MKHSKGTARMAVWCLLAVMLFTQLAMPTVASGQGFSPCIALETVDLYPQPGMDGDPLYQVGPGTALMVQEVIHDAASDTDWSAIRLQSGTAYALTSKLRALDTLSSVQPPAQEEDADLTAPEEHRVTETPYKVNITLKKEVKPSETQRHQSPQVRALITPRPQPEATVTPDPIPVTRTAASMQLRDASKTSSAEQADENVTAFFVTSDASLHADASADSDILFTIDPGTIVLAGEAVSGAQGTLWYPVLLEEGEGWVAAEHLQAMNFFVGDTPADTVAHTDRNAVAGANIYAYPHANGHPNPGGHGFAYPCADSHRDVHAGSDGHRNGCADRDADGHTAPEPFGNGYHIALAWGRHGNPHDRALGRSPFHRDAGPAGHPGTAGQQRHARGGAAGQLGW